MGARPAHDVAGTTRLAADFGEGMDARTAWVMARLARHPDEHGYAMGHLDDDSRAAD
ncbi:hypothetical protein ACU6WZ_28490 (plasmid) [Streptomyces hypolithicus]